MKHDRDLQTSGNVFFRVSITVGRHLSLSLIGLVLLCMPIYTAAQNVQYNNKGTDLGMRSSRKVNPSTRGMEIQIPLGHYPGRNGLDVPVTLSYSSKLWGVEFQGYNTGAPPPHQPPPFTIVTADYAKHSVRGWTTTIGMPVVDLQPGNRIYDQFGSPNVTGNCTNGCWVVDRLMVWMADGSGHEMRASDQPRQTTAPVPDEYYAVDGSRMRYQKSTQTLFMPDGSRYLISAGKYIDRNGNTLTWNGGSWTDTLNRTINTPLPYNAGSGPLSPVDQSVSLPGVGGTLNYTLKWRNLADVLTTPQTLRYTASGGCPPGTGGAYSPYLFGSDSGSSTCFGNAGVLFNPVVLWQIVLPNGQNYTFSYDIYGTIEKIVLPTGGYERFEHGAIPPLSSPTNYKWVYGQANRGVSRHVISATGLAGDEVEWVYTGTNNSVSVTAPDGSRSERFIWVDGNSGWTYSQDAARAGMTYDERVYAPSGQMIRRKLTDWVMTPSNAGGFPSGAEIATRNPRIAREVEFLLDTSGPALARSRTYGYDTTYQWTVGVEQTAVNEFAYLQVDLNTAQTIPITSLGSIPNGTLLRTTETDYLTGDINYRSRNILGTPTATRIKNGAGTVVAQSTLSYDEASFPLLLYASVVGWTDPATPYRANATSFTSWLNFNGSTLSTFPSGTYLARHTQFDQCGSVRKKWDASDTSLTNPTLTDYSATYHFAYPTTQTTADPDGVGPKLPLTSTTEFDLSTGLVTATIDPNSQRTTFNYSDPLNRLKQIIRAETDPTAKSQTTYTYDDVAHTTTITSDLTTYNDNTLKSVSFYDGLGRVQETRKYETALTFITVLTQYDNMGRVFKTSNPYRPPEPVLWTITAYDGLGRVLSVMTPDNAVVTKSYSTNSQTVTDQAGKVRQGLTDSLDRLVELYEDPSNLNYQTSYAYDTLDNLVTVTQGSQQRFFMYDSLERPIRSRIPEQVTNSTLNLSDPLTSNSSWTSGYQYDNNGNPTFRTDARGIVTENRYDALDRVTTILYRINGQPDPNTGDVEFLYDSATNGKGRLWLTYKWGSKPHHTAVGSYDALGRVTQFYNLFGDGQGGWSAGYAVNRSYNLAGLVTSQSYPSGRTVTYSYDGAGRTSNFSGTLGDGANRTYATDISYSPFGGLAREQFGTNTPLYHKSFYNIRGQFFDTRVSSVNDTWDWNRGRLILYYSSNHIWGQSGTDNNGNVRFAETWIPPENATLDQTDTLIEDSYDYDGANRIKYVAEQRLSVSTGWVWQSQFRQTYVYDRYGNRTINGDPSQTWGTGINNKQFTVDTTNNRLGVPSGQTGTMSYDNAGNLTADTYTGVGARSYDAENRMITAVDNSGQTSRYSYDAAGNRVRRQVASSQEEWQIYGIDGELVAEYRAGVATSSPEKEYGYRNGQLLVTATGRYNVALASNGAVATASSAHTCCGFSTTGAINGNFRGPWGNGEGWNDATDNVVPDWIQVDFAGSKSIDEISVFSLHDNYTQENNPTETQTFSLYGLIAFDVQYWNGSSWVTIPAGSVTGNNKVWRKFTFSAITTSKIRVFINQVPDSWSRVVEIQAFGTSAGGEKVQWLVADHLGTPRMVIDQNGTLTSVKRHDYLPFGEELFAGTGGRTTALGYAGNDGVRQQFTQKERDVETGLDYFLARYYSSVQGRFTSTDPLRASGRPSVPQSWNRYTYVLNNPLSLVDPTGLVDDDAQQKQQQQQKQAEQQIPQQGYYIVIKVGPNERINGRQTVNGHQVTVIGSRRQLQITVYNNGKEVKSSNVTVSEIVQSKDPTVTKNGKTVPAPDAIKTVIALGASDSQNKEFSTGEEGKTIGDTQQLVIAAPNPKTAERIANDFNKQKLSQEERIIFNVKVDKELVGSRDIQSTKTLRNINVTVGPYHDVSRKP